ncbi:MAG: hypothetical protein ACFCBU_00455, partial [Cyanophyceae cyanobacterium]
TRKPLRLNLGFGVSGWCAVQRFTNIGTLLCLVNTFESESFGGIRGVPKIWVSEMGEKVNKA